jgi:hypothetical protein
MGTTDTDRIELIKKRKKIGNKNSALRNKKFQMYRDMYYNKYTSPLMRTTASQIRNPKVFQLVESQASSFTTSAPKGIFLPMNDAMTSASYELNELYRYQWDKAGMVLKLHVMIKNSIILGMQPVKLCWRYDEDDNYDSWDVEPLRLESCMFDPSWDPSLPYTHAQWFLYEEIVNIDELKEINKAKGKVKYQNLAKLESMMADGDVQKYDSDGEMQDADVSREIATSNDDKYDTSTKKVKIIRMFERKRWTAYAPAYDLLIQDIENPYEHGELPIHILYNSISPDSVYGISDVEPVAGLVDAMNTLMSQKMDAGTYSLNPAFTAEGFQSTEGIVFEAGSIIGTSAGQKILPIQIQDNAIQTYQQEMQMLQQSFQDATGVLDSTKSNADSTALNRTATGVKASVVEQNVRKAIKIKLLEEFIESLARQAMKLNAQFVTDQMVVRVTNKESMNYLRNQQTQMDSQAMQNPTTFKGNTVPVDGKSTPRYTEEISSKIGFLYVTKKDVEGDYDFRVDTESLSQADPIVEQGKMDKLAILLFNPQVHLGLMKEGKSINMTEFVEKYAQSLTLSNIDMLFTTPEQQQTQQSSMGNAAYLMGIRPKEVMNYKDLPPEGQAQMASQVGIQLNNGQAQGGQPQGQPQSQPQPQQQAPQAQPNQQPQQQMQAPQQPQMPQGGIDPQVLNIIQAIKAGKLDPHDPNLAKDPHGAMALHLLSQGR